MALPQPHRAAKLEQAASYRRYRESIGKPMYDDNDAWPVG
jgi:hypothetical protein